MSSKLTNLLKRKMEEKHLSVASLEKMAGLKESVVRNILQGKSKNPTIDTISSIAEALGCTIDELIKGENIADKASEDYTKPDIKWNYELFLDTVKVTNSIITDQSIAFNADKTIFAVKEIYCYSVSKNCDSTDYNFAEWFITNLKNNLIKT